MTSTELREELEQFEKIYGKCDVFAESAIRQTREGPVRVEVTVVTASSYPEGGLSRVCMLR